MNLTGFTDHFLHGGDYNPEQWLNMPEILEKDLDAFRKAGINVVTLGMFSWGMLEPEEGRYEFGWLENCIQSLYKRGISVILGTPSGARPKWLAKRYPEVLRVNERRERNLYGGRHNHCYTSPMYREKVQKINEELAKRVGSHPGVILWHLSNEYGGECHCPLCQAKFQEWLRKRYGDIGKLNEKWYTTFWSHQYDTFEDIESPSELGETDLHALVLDWKRFVTDRTLDFIRAEKEAVRKYSDKPVTTNLMYDYDGLNYEVLQEELDLVSWDNYPLWHRCEEWKTALDTGFQHDYFRSLKNAPFLLMESSPSSTNWQSVSKLQKPGMLFAASLQAIAHGSDSVMYFQMRKSRGASEKFHGALLDHYGETTTRVFREVSQIGEALREIGKLAGSVVKSKAAVLFDRENDWAIKESQGPRNIGMHYGDCVKKHYHALRSLGVNVDVGAKHQKLDTYQIVAAPMGYMMKEEQIRGLKEFARQGGILILTYWSAIVDETDQCYLGGIPHGLIEASGVRSTEMDALYEEETNTADPVCGNHLGIEKSYRCKTICDLIETKDAEILMRYRKDFYSGWPAVTCRGYGKGRIYYICSDFEEDFYQDFYRRIAGTIPGFQEIEADEGISVSTREKENKRYLFLINFSRQESYAKVPMSYRCFWGSGEMPMKPLAVYIYERDMEER